MTCTCDQDYMYDVTYVYWRTEEPEVSCRIDIVLYCRMGLVELTLTASLLNQGSIDVQTTQITVHWVTRLCSKKKCQSVVD